MAKSLRSKVKRSFRNKKREEGVYAAVHAARLQRLNSKLIETAKKDVNGDVSLDAPADEESADVPAEQNAAETQPDAMAIDASADPKRISTSGPRNSRRVAWRESKGMEGRPALKAMNRQGGVAGRRKSGKSHRRR
ncbi:hypothetical protein DFP72DRAFT_876866 [Ephemerocybe angulata]|uniref:DUF2423 domain-containing protein n=1 Tax=Ephemerocybe angulata TaxID=980116 RepID=A0A8H6IC16_9AGAR|nr:hypothetical protein DFP72DRAFT_876866 [Tulosesus angulatus]